jgi:hypothetical protein
MRFPKSGLYISAIPPLALGVLAGMGPALGHLPRPGHQGETVLAHQGDRAVLVEGQDADGQGAGPHDDIVGGGPRGRGGAGTHESVVVRVTVDPITGVKVEEDGSVMVFWIDAYEDAFSMPGVVILFGKVHTQTSTETR